MSWVWLFSLGWVIMSVAFSQTDLTNDLISSWQPTWNCSLSTNWTLSMRQRWVCMTCSWLACLFHVVLLHDDVLTLVLIYLAVSFGDPGDSCYKLPLCRTVHRHSLQHPLYVNVFKSISMARMLTQLKYICVLDLILNMHVLKCVEMCSKL